MSLLRAGQTLEQLTYFTARVRNDLEDRQRQSDYLDALASHSPLVAVVDGRFQEKYRHCRSCGAAWTVYEEKETDVNIAAALIEDAVLDRYDTALLISADSDLCPAIVTMKRIRPEKRIIAAFPPKRHSADLKRAVDGYLPSVMTRSVRRSCRLRSSTTLVSPCAGRSTGPEVRMTVYDNLRIARCGATPRNHSCP